MQVRLSGEGDVGLNGGPPGNLYVRVEVQRHAHFQRDGYDLVYRLPLNLAEATLGAEKVVPTLDKTSETLKIPQGTQPGTEFRIRNKGIPHLNGNRRGDLRVVVDLQVPRELSSHQRRLLEELALSWNHDSGTENGEDGNQDKGLFDRLKDALG